MHPIKAYLNDELYELSCSNKHIFDFMQEADDGLFYWNIIKTDSAWGNPGLLKRIGMKAESQKSVNNPASRLLSSDRDKLLGDIQQNLQTIAPADAERRKARLYPGSDPSAFLPAELHFRHAVTDETITFGVRYQLLCDDRERPCRLLCALNQADDPGPYTPRAHHENNSLMRAMTTSNQDAIILMDDEGSIRFWNPAAELLFGYSAAEIMGENLHELIAPKRYHEQFRERFKRYRQSGEVRAVNDIVEMAALHKNGREVPVELSLSTVLLKGRRETIGILREISARKDAETELRKLSKAVEQSPAIVLITNPDGNIEYVNQKFVDITGYSREEVRGRNPRILKSGAQSRSFYEDLWSTITKGYTWKGDFRNRKKSGENYWESASITPILNDDGDIINYLGIKEDITKRKRAEMALKKSEERYKSIIKVSNTGAWEYDSQTGWLWCSKEYFEMLGYNSAEIPALQKKADLKAAWVDLIHPREQEQASRIFKEYLADMADSGAVYENTFRMRHKDGHWVWVWSRGRCLNTPEGIGSHKVLGTHINITERKLAEQQLKESELYHRSLLKTIPDMIFVMDKHGRYLDFKANRDDLYLSPEKFLNRYVKDVMPPHLAIQQMQAIEKALAKQEVVEFQFSLPHKGVVSHFRARFVAFGEDRVIALASDITESVRNLNRIKSLLKVEEEQNKRLRSFTHIVSHNLRNHTANMKGIFSLMKAEKPELLQEEYIAMLNQASEKLNDTIDHLNEVLDLTLKTKEMSVPVNLYTVLQDGIGSVAQLARDAGVRILNKVDKACSVCAIPAYLESIVLNMLTNAIRFRSADKDSYVIIEAETDEQIEMLRLRFQDNGLGIDLQRYKEKMFGMYKTFHGHPDSHGLGLFMSKHQAEAMGATIEVESEPGRGTTFTVGLPYSTDKI